MKGRNQKGWERLKHKHHHGIQLPLLSIRTKKSSGNGEFLDLLPLIDWMHDLGMDLLQLLPLNDSAEDPSPYNAISSTALHPIYISLHALPGALDLSHFKKYQETKRIAYNELLILKERFLREYVSKHREEIRASEDYRSFLDAWPDLTDYARFKTRRQNNLLSSWKSWPIEPKSKGLTEEEEVHLIVQYIASSQLLSVRRYAESKGILLKGDIPYLISLESADLWAHSEFFDLSYQAGSPPTSFDPKGQNWKFPLYNWRAMEQNHFEWWKKRIQSAARFFHLYRLDHILGFFRIWAIPPGGDPEEGHFIPKDPALMKCQGEAILKVLLSFSEMLPIGEDIGDPPPFIHEVMEELGIPGIKLLRLARRLDEKRSFIPLDAYPPSSVSTVSTHDFEPLKLWWTKFPDEARAFSAFKGGPITQLSQESLMKRSSMIAITLQASFISISCKNILPLFQSLPGRTRKMK